MVPPVLRLLLWCDSPCAAWVRYSQHRVQLYGILSGAAISGIPSSIGALSYDKMNEIGARSGLTFTFEGASVILTDFRSLLSPTCTGVATLVGPPLGGAVLRASAPYVALSLYGGFSFVVAFALTAWSRQLLARRRGTWRV